MYSRRFIRLRYILAGSWAFLILVTAWALAVVLLHQMAGFHWLVMPVLPVTLVGIAVSLYVSFKSVSAYNRWWEARQTIGSISSHSREWAILVQSLIYNDEGKAPADAERTLLHRHLGWVFAVAHVLRKTSRLKPSEKTRVFQYRRVGHETTTMHEATQSYGHFLDPEEYAAAQNIRNPPFYILRQQARHLRQLTASGYLDSIRLDAMTALLNKLDHCYGICMRIKTTPFPRQIANFGTIFTWVFIFILPLAFLDVFGAEAVRDEFSKAITHEYVFMIVPFSVAISWVFFMMEKVSDSSEDPFEGGMHDVPLSAVCRLIEINIKEALSEDDVPPPLKPVDDVLY